MSNDSLAAGEGALLQGADLVRDAKADLDKKLADLKSTCEGIGVGWIGAGRRAFDGLMENWSAETAKLTESLTEFETNLRGTDKALSANEAETESNFAKYAGRLGRTS